MHAAFTLAEQTRDPVVRVAALRLAVQHMFALPRPRAARWLGEYAPTFTALPRDEALSLLARMIVSAGHDGSWPLADLCGPELVELLRWLGGEATLASTLEHLRDVERWLGR